MYTKSPPRARAGSSGFSARAAFLLRLRALLEARGDVMTARVQTPRMRQLAPLAACLLLALPTRADEPPPRVFADSFITWIYPRPSFEDQPIGYLRAGTTALRRDEPPVRSAGCSGGFQAIEPAGYVCLGRSATTEATRYTGSLASLAPSPGPFPFGYALSMGSPAYRRLPTPSEVRRQENKFGPASARPLPPHWSGHEELVGGEHPTSGAVPPFLADGGSASRASEQRLVRREVPFGSMIAVSGSFEHDGRQYLMSADGTVVPAARFLPFRPSNFAGVQLSRDLELPLAWTRRATSTHENGCTEADAASPAPGRLAKASTLAASCMKASTEQLGVRALVPLTGRRHRVGKRLFVEARDRTWLSEADLYVAERPEQLASSASKWILFSISRGTLVAFEGARAVFATLASPGIGGRPRAGGSALDDRTTPLGTFRIQFKHRTDDMSPEQSEHRSFFIADVPYAQFFQPPFAIHVAYWHESFGEPMSGGCINVSPRDGETLFSWTDPPLPPGWHGVGAGKAFGPGTWVRIVAD